MSVYRALLIWSLVFAPVVREKSDAMAQNQRVITAVVDL
jgi:hypothetical protein